ncbi:glycoside hydrolase family 108 protein [Burkholderia pseudomallei]
MDNFERAFELVVGIEAGFTNDPGDPGNWTGGKPSVGVLKGTKYGISAAAYPNVDIANLTLDGAHAIYTPDYWQACGCDKMPWPLCLFVFDMAVNQGQPLARVMLQRTLGVAADGVIGPVTLAAANKMNDEQLALLLTARAFRYMLSDNFQVDGRGWFKRLFLMAFSHDGG